MQRSECKMSPQAHAFKLLLLVALFQGHGTLGFRISLCFALELADINHLCNYGFGAIQWSLMGLTKGCTPKDVHCPSLPESISCQ